MPKNTQPIALLIDGDNIPIGLIPRVFEEAAPYGNPIIREVFLNKHSIESWDQTIINFALTPTYVPANIDGKNAADIALAVRAMELLYESEGLEGFCIVSSDSDFTSLAKKIVEKNRPILGIGEGKTPDSFRYACTEFIVLEGFQQLHAPPKIQSALPDPNALVFATTPEFEKLFIKAYERALKKTKGAAVMLTDIREALQKLNDSYDDTLLKNMRSFAIATLEMAQGFPDGVITITEHRTETSLIYHTVQIDCDAFKFIEVYKHIEEKEQGVWVSLSTLGTALKKYPVYKDGYLYHGVRNSTLVKFIEAMQKDHSKIITMSKKNSGRVKVKL